MGRRARDRRRGEHVQGTGRTDVEDGQEAGPATGDLDSHVVSGAEPDLVGGRWNLLHVSGHAARPWLRMGRGDGSPCQMNSDREWSNDVLDVVRPTECLCRWATVWWKDPSHLFSSQPSARVKDPPAR